MQQTFGKWVKSARKSLDLTQDELAERVGYSRSTIQSIEQNRLRPSIEGTRKVAEALQIHEEEYEHFVMLGRQQPAKQYHRTTSHTPAEHVAINAAPDAVEVLQNNDSDEHIETIVDSNSTDSADSDSSLSGTRISIGRNNVLLAVRKRWWLVIVVFIGLATIVPIAFKYLSSTNAISGILHLVARDQEFVLVETSSGPIGDGDIIRQGERITVTFSIRNMDTHKIIIRTLTAGSRGPGAQEAGWDAPVVAFPSYKYIALEPGEIYQYRASRIMWEQGDFFVEPAIRAPEGWWGGIEPFTRINFQVQ